MNDKQRAVLKYTLTEKEARLSNSKITAFKRGHLGYVEDNPNGNDKLFYPDNRVRFVCFPINESQYELIWTDYKPEYHPEIEKWYHYITESTQYDVAAKLFDMEKEIEQLKHELKIANQNNPYWIGD
jgi:hypothetical protein